MNALRLITLAAACALPLAAPAQWQWIDKDGRKVFSDRAPPPDVPASKILKQPGARALPVPEAVAAAPAASAASAPGRPANAASAPKVSGKDKELEEKKKAQEAAEAEKKKAEEAKVAEAKADNCKRAKQTKATYDSGVRVARTNEKGQREILDDKQRADEIKRLDGIIASDCAQ